MNKEYLKIALDDARISIIGAIRDYVFEHGEEPSREKIEEFGLEEEEDDGYKVTKILDFFNSDGCCYYYPVRSNVNNDACEDINDENWYDILYSEFEYAAMQCLYLHEDEEGNEELMYYCFSNGGVKWDDDQAEPHHDCVDGLAFEELVYIIDAIQKMK